MRKIIASLVIACTMLGIVGHSLADQRDVERTERMLEVLGTIDKDYVDSVISLLQENFTDCKKSRKLILAHFKTHFTEEVAKKDNLIAALKSLDGEDSDEDNKIINRCHELPLISFGKIFQPIWDKDNSVEAEFLLSEIGAVWQQRAGRLFLLYDAIRQKDKKFAKAYKKHVIELVKFGAEECTDEDFDWDFYGGHPNNKGKIIPEKIKSDESLSKKKAYKKIKEAVKEAKIGNHEDALEIINALLAKVKKAQRAECLSALAKVHTFNEEYTKAIKYHRLACKLEPNNYKMWLERGWTYWLFDDNLDGFKYLTKAIRLARKSKNKKAIYNAYYMRAYCYVYQLHYRRAIADCEAAQTQGKSKSCKVEALLLELYTCTPPAEGLYDKKKTAKLFKKLRSVTLSKISIKKRNKDVVGRIYFSLAACLAKEGKFKQINKYIKNALKYSKDRRDRYKFVGVNENYFKQKKAYTYKEGKPTKLPEYNDDPNAKDEDDNKKNKKKKPDIDF